MYRAVVAELEWPRALEMMLIGVFSFANSAANVWRSPWAWIRRSRPAFRPSRNRGQGFVAEQITDCGAGVGAQKLLGDVPDDAMAVATPAERGCGDEDGYQGNSCVAGSGWHGVIVPGQLATSMRGYVHAFGDLVVRVRELLQYLSLFVDTNHLLLASRRVANEPLCRLPRTLTVRPLNLPEAIRRIVEVHGPGYPSVEVMSAEFP